MSTTRYICCRCDIRTDSAFTDHVCFSPTDNGLNLAIAAALEIDARTLVCGERTIGLRIRPDSTFGGFVIDQPETWALSLNACLRDLAPIALSRGYRWSLSSVGDGTEYRATFEAHLGSPEPSALDTTPARAFARAWLRMMVMDHEMEHPMKGFT